MTRDEKKAATRKKLLLIAKAAFSRQPYESVTFRGLARAAVVSTGSYFSNWPDKASLYLEAMGKPHGIGGFADFVARVAITCSGHPGDVGKLAQDAEALHRQIVG